MTEALNGSTGAVTRPGSFLEVRHLSTHLPTERGVVHAVDEVSFDLVPGETLAIVGESGSGKSMLVRSVMGLAPASASISGSVRFRERELDQMPREELRRLWGSEIALIMQDPMTALNPVYRIERQLVEVLRLHLQLGKTEARARALELLGAVRIPDPARCLRLYPHELSGGMRQRVCIALAISCDPSVLFADEPTTALDVTVQRQILDLLTDIQHRSDTALVLITHDLAVVAGRTDRVMVMYGGRVVEVAETATLFSSMRHPYTAALLASIPRLRYPSHTRLFAIPGRPAAVVDPSGCRFAPRCSHAQERCLIEEPVAVRGAGDSHAYACFYPVGTAEGERARERNVRKGCTAAGLELHDDHAEVSAS